MKAVMLLNTAMVIAGLNTPQQTLNVMLKQVKCARRYGSYLA